MNPKGKGVKTELVSNFQFLSLTNITAFSEIMKLPQKWQEIVKRKPPKNNKIKMFNKIEVDNKICLILINLNF